jgi:D-alanyl-D-alanine carboxypeptidase (penicillin-binding protein 5/6)
MALATLLLPCSPAALALTPTKSSGPPAQIARAPVALLVDVTSGQVLHARNPARRFVPASITKTMSAFVAFDLMRKGRLDPARVMRMSPEIYRDWHHKGSTMYLDTQTPVRVEELLLGLMTVSANDAAVVLAEGTSGSVDQWVALMNSEARELGMTSSHFGTPNGWPDEGRTFTTASDLAKLADALIARYPDEFARYIGNREFGWNGITQRNHDPLLGVVVGADGLKTGYTGEAGYGFLGTAKRGRQRLVLVLAGLDSSRVRDELAREYIEWGFNAFDRQSLYAKGEFVGTARVQNGSAREVGLLTERQVRVNVPKDRRAELSATIRYDGPVQAPIRAGERIGTLEIAVPGMEPARVPLVAQRDIGKAGFFARFWNGFAGWFS